MRARSQQVKDFITFPVRAVLPVHESRWGLTSRPDERFEYVAREISGRVLDIGCGRHNAFISRYASGNGVGIDVFRYDGLDEENIVDDMAHLPFPDASFDTVTFIACFNHIPKTERDAEVREAFRVLRKGGKVVVTMGNPLAELAIHRLVHGYDRLLGTKLDMDTERGMHEDEEYFVRDRVIVEHLAAGGFREIRKRYFITQWGLNHLLTARRPA